MMKGMIFAAGLGTRLRPLTDTMPKAMVPVSGIPALRRVIESMKEAGVTRIVVNVHHFPDVITDYLADNGFFGIDISVSDERDCLLDTGGGLLKARHLLDDGSGEPILLHNADIVTDIDLRRITLPQGCAASLLVSDRHSSRQLMFDSGMNLRGWMNHTTGETRPARLDGAASLIPLSFNGIHLFSPEAFDALELYARETASEVFSITPFYVWAATSASLSIHGCRISGYHWFDIGKPATLAAADAFFASSI